MRKLIALIIVGLIACGTAEARTASLAPNMSGSLSPSTAKQADNMTVGGVALGDKVWGVEQGGTGSTSIGVTLTNIGGVFNVSDVVNPIGSTTSYTILPSDMGKTLTHTAVSQVTDTLPEAGTTGFEATKSITIINAGTERVVVTPVVSTLNGSTSSLTLNPKSALWALSDGSNWWGFSSVNSANGCVGYTPPLDDQPSKAVAAFSLRLLRSGHSGGNIVKVSRSSDNTEKVFTATVPTCSIDVKDAFFDGSTYKVVTWYDQSGNGADVTQASAAYRPTLTLNCKSGQPCITNTADFEHKLSGSLAAPITSASFAAVANITSQAASSYIAYVGTTTSATGVGYNQPLNLCAALRYVSSSPYRGTSACSASTWYRYLTIQNNTLGRIYVNGVGGTDDTTSLTLTANSSLNIGASSGGTLPMAGNIAEVIVFSPDLTVSDGTAVSINQGAYWGI